MNGGVLSTVVLATKLCRSPVVCNSPINLRLCECVTIGKIIEVVCVGRDGKGMRMN